MNYRRQQGQQGRRGQTTPYCVRCRRNLKLEGSDLCTDCNALYSKSDRSLSDMLQRFRARPDEPIVAEEGEEDA